MKTFNNLSTCITFTVIGGLFLLLTGCVTAKQKKLEAGFKPLSNHELQTLFSKNNDATFVSNKNGMVTSMTYFKDGRQKFSNSKLSDEGNWRIVGDTVCSVWKELRQGAEECTTFFQSADNKFEVYKKTGTLYGVLTFN